MRREYGARSSSLGPRTLHAGIFFCGRARSPAITETLLAAPPALGRSPPRLLLSACSPTPGASSSSSTAPSPGRPGAPRGDADGDTPRPRGTRGAATPRPRPARPASTWPPRPRRARREAEDVELLMPILLPDPVLLPLSAAALRSAAVTFSSLAASSSLLALARSALVSSSCVVMGKMSIIIIIRSYILRQQQRPSIR